MKTLIILCLLLSANMASASWVSEKVKKAETWVDRHVLKQGVEQAAIPALAQVAVATSGIAKTITTIEQTVTEVRTPLLTSAWLLAVLLLSAAVRSLLSTLRLLIPATARADRPAHEATTGAERD